MYWKKLIVPAVIVLAFWALGITLWQASGYLAPLFLFGYIGTSLGVGLGLYGLLPKPRKTFGRKLTLFLVGLFLFVWMGILAQENIQLEGVLFGVLTGVFQAGVMHYLIAKIIGPLLFGRLWCGWACWTVMVLDLLPFPRSKGRVPGPWGKLRVAHFGLSVALVLLMWFGFGIAGVTGPSGVIWFVAGNALYYAVAIGLAYALQDNRAFCKYVCPVTVPLKLTARFSLLKVKGDPAACNDCQACIKACPMDIRVAEYHRQGLRVLSTECSLCQTCITVCPHDALKLSFGLDRGGKELLRERELPLDVG